MQSDLSTVTQKPNPIVAIWNNALLQAFLNDPVTLLSAVFLFVIVMAAVFCSPSFSI